MPVVPQIDPTGRSPEELARRAAMVPIGEPLITGVGVWDRINVPAMVAPPAAAEWTVINLNAPDQFGRTANLDRVINEDGLVGLSVQTNTGPNRYRMLVRPAPSPPYTATAGVTVAPGLAQAGQAGIGLRDAATGRAIVLVYTRPNELRASSWTNFVSVTDTGSATTLGRWIGGITHGPGLWLRIVDNGTTIALQTAVVPRVWRTVASLGRTSWMTPTQIGLVALAHGGDDVAVVCHHWQVT